ncbi:MAG TPA: O-antigen ligase family protein [Stellaceae bacterium]
MERADAAAFWLEAGLDLCAFLLMPMLALVPHGAAPLAAFAGLCAAGLVMTRGASLRPLFAPAVLLGGLLLWGAVSAIGAIDPVRSLVLDLQLAGLFLAALALAAAAERIASPWRMALCLMAGAALGLMLAGYDLATDGGLTRLISVRGFRPARLDQIAIGLAILALPASAALFSRRKAAGAGTLIAAAGGVFLLDDASAKAALIAAVPVAAIAFWRPRGIARLAAALSVLFIVTAPLTLPKLASVPGLVAEADSFKISAGHRLLVWSFVGERIAERPFSGWGLDSSRAIPGGNVEARLGQNWLPLHPHDAALQVWLELGAPGAVLFAALVALFWLRLDRLGGPRLYAAAAAGALMATLAPEFAAYGVWQEWWIGTLALALFLVMVMARDAETSAATATPPRQRGWRGGDR